MGIYRTLVFGSAFAIAIIMSFVVPAGSLPVSPVSVIQGPSELSGSIIPDGSGIIDITNGRSIRGVDIFPADHVWNTKVNTLDADPRSDLLVNSIGRDISLHPDFGSGLWNGKPIGIPFNIVSGSPAKEKVRFYYPDESDRVRYPIPKKPKIEGGSDRHILIVSIGEKKLYELYDAHKRRDGWHAGSGAVYSLTGYELRPETWTSADAAGLPILPGLVRYDEVASGEIRHALRFTAPVTNRSYIWPARHYASSDTSGQYPPMGQRFRLKANFDISGFSLENQVILTALKEYGMILADNGAAWFITGAPDSRWNNTDLHRLHEVTGSDFEAVNCTPLMIDPDSGQARQEL